MKPTPVELFHAIVEIVSNHGHIGTVSFRDDVITVDCSDSAPDAGNDDLRERAAIAAMRELIASNPSRPVDGIAEDSVAIADALVAELRKGR